MGFRACPGGRHREGSALPETPLTNFITLPRSQLYDLVWTKPVTELAKRFGISDVALASAAAT